MGPVALSISLLISWATRSGLFCRPRRTSASLAADSQSKYTGSTGRICSEPKYLSRYRLTGAAKPEGCWGEETVSQGRVDTPFCCRKAAVDPPTLLSPKMYTRDFCSF